MDEDVKMTALPRALTYALSYRARLPAHRSSLSFFSCLPFFTLASSAFSSPFVAALPLSAIFICQAMTIKEKAKASCGGERRRGEVLHRQNVFLHVDERFLLLYLPASFTLLFSLNSKQ